MCSFPPISSPKYTPHAWLIFTRRALKIPRSLDLISRSPNIATLCSPRNLLCVVTRERFSLFLFLSAWDLCKVAVAYLHTCTTVFPTCICGGAQWRTGEWLIEIEKCWAITLDMLCEHFKVSVSGGWMGSAGEASMREVRSFRFNLEAPRFVCVRAFGALECKHQLCELGAK